MDELLKIPADATAATVQGIEMLLIDENKAGALLESDPVSYTHLDVYKRQTQDGDSEENSFHGGIVL